MTTCSRNPYCTMCRVLVKIDRSLSLSTEALIQCRRCCMNWRCRRWLTTCCRLRMTSTSKPAHWLGVQAMACWKFSVSNVRFNYQRNYVANLNVTYNQLLVMMEFDCTNKTTYCPGSFFYARLTDQNGRRRHSVLRLSVCLSATTLVNTILWKWMNWFLCQLAQAIRQARAWNVQLWGQRSRSHVAEDRFRVLINFDPFRSSRFLSCVSMLLRDIDIGILSVRTFIHNIPVLDENGLTYCHSFFHLTVAQSF